MPRDNHVPEGFVYDPARRMWVCPDDIWSEKHAAANSFGCFGAFIEAKRGEYLQALAGPQIDGDDRAIIHQLDEMV